MTHQNRTRRKTLDLIQAESKNGNKPRTHETMREEKQSEGPYTDDGR